MSVRVARRIALDYLPCPDPDFPMPIQSSPLIQIKQTAGKGRGVFAIEFIPAGTVIERVPVIVIPSDEVMIQPGRVLQQYVFEWGRGTVAIALGFGSIYNHSYLPNARYDDKGRQTKIFTALKDIQPGDEITVNYNGDENDSSPVGFSVFGEPTADESAEARFFEAAVFHAEESVFK